MGGPAVDHHYRYLFPSELDADQEPELRLATCDDTDSHPYFFTGSLRHPYLTSRLFLSLAWLLRSRFHLRPDQLPPGIADPIVTAHEAFVRLEVFSGCCSAYARVDLPESALDGETLSRGTTNVDFNPGMIAALGRVRPTDHLQLQVGADELVLQRDDDRVVEKRVPLPVRWLKGLVAVTPYSSRLACRHSVNGRQALRFLRGVPRRVDHRSRWWVCRSGKGLRLSQRETRDAVQIGGLERLRVLEDLAHLAESMRIYGADGIEASGWELDFGDARITLLLTHDVWRGFSGEGAGLEQLLAPLDNEALLPARAALRWQAQIDPDDDMNRSESSETVRRGLEQLATQGLVGFDASAGKYFHRELPFELDYVRKLQPRLSGAQKLVAAGSVARNADGSCSVQGSDTIHAVRVSAEGYRCTCPWYARHERRRGPCKHILAVQLWEESVDGT